MTLSGSKLWERVRGLEGETICAIQQCKPNRISRVTANRVEGDGESFYQYRQGTGKLSRGGSNGPF